MLSQPTTTNPTVPEPESPRTKRTIVTVVIILIVVLGGLGIAGAANGIILHNATIMKPNSNLSIPIIASYCGSATTDTCADQPCVTSDGKSAGTEVNNKCYVDIFDNTDY